MMIIAAAIAVAGVFAPWLVSTRGGWLNGLTNPVLGGGLVVAELLVVAVCLLGKRDQRLEGPAFATAVLLALAVAAFAILVFVSLLGRGQIGADDGGLMQFSAGLFVVIGGSLLVVIFAFAIGRPEKPSVGSVMTGWSRRE